MSIAIRRASVAGDRGLLLDMLVAAAGWAPDRPATRETVRADPHTAHYVDGWPADGDLGVVAERDGIGVGAAWLRRFPADDPGYGFVDVDVPELSIGVDPAHRGRGVGTLLLRELTAAAADTGVVRISLSVERANPAVRLYQREGFTAVASGPDALTMVVRLRPRS